VKSGLCAELNCIYACVYICEYTLQHSADFDRRSRLAEVQFVVVIVRVCSMQYCSHSGYC